MNEGSLTKIEKKSTEREREKERERDPGEIKQQLLLLQQRPSFWCCLPILSFVHTFFFSLSLSHTHTHSLSLYLSLTHTHIHINSFSLTHTYTQAHTFTHTLFLSHTHLHTSTHIYTHTLSLSHTHTTSITNNRQKIKRLPLAADLWGSFCTRPGANSIVDKNDDKFFLSDDLRFLSGN